MWPFWRPKPLTSRDGHAFDADFAERVLDFFEFERFDDGFDFFHVAVTLASRGALQPSRNASQTDARRTSGSKPLMCKRFDGKILNKSRPVLIDQQFPEIGGIAIKNIEIHPGDDAVDPARLAMLPESPVPVDAGSFLLQIMRHP